MPYNNPPIAADANSNQGEAGTATNGGLSSLEHVKRAYRASSNVNQVELNRFARYYSLYRGRQMQKNYRGLANLFVPEPHRIVVRKSAKIVNAIKSIRVKPAGKSDVENSRNSTILMNYLSERLSMPNFYRSLIKEARILSMSWAKVTWDAGQEENGQQWKGFRVDPFSVDRIFVNPTATIIDMFTGKLDYLIAEYDANIDDLEKNKNYNADVIKRIKAKAGNKKPENVLSQQRQINRQGAADRAEPFPNQKHYVQEFWGKKDGKNMIIVICDNEFVLRDEVNPYAEILTNPIPFVPFPASIEPHETYPIGDIEPNESLFNELNDTRNQRMDTVTLNIDPAKIILRSAQIDEKELVAKRGWTIHSNVANGVTFVPPDMQGIVAAINEEKIIRGDIQQSTGVLDFAPQSDVQAGINIDTARGAVIAKGESDVLTQEEIDITKESLKMLWRIMLAYSQKFMTEQFEMRITENGHEDFKQFTNEGIAGNFDMDIEMETLQDMTTRQQMSILLFNQAKEVPGANIGKFFTDMLLNFKENVNIEEYYQEPQPQPPAPPSISISLKGELNELQASQIYKTIPNVDPAFADPITLETGRQLMRGDLPEHKKAEADKLQSETKKNLAATDKTIAETAAILTPEEKKPAVSAQK